MIDVSKEFCVKMIKFYNFGMAKELLKYVERLLGIKRNFKLRMFIVR